jgi:hypothetical protein
MVASGRARTDERGQTAPIGVVLVLGIVLLGTTVIVALGGAAITSTQERSEINAAEHAMTQFDSQAAQVALGDTSVQSVRFGRMGGSYSVEPSSGTITVTHIDYDGSADEELFSGKLGAVVYRNGDTTIAYQGGGVWRKDENGGVSMVSPPEFHYRSGTLTLPVIRAEGSGGASGDVVATIVRDTTPDRHYPNPSSNYNGDDSPDRKYLNPIAKGTVHITVQSEYYEGWAHYFRDRTDGTVTVDDANEEVTVELETIGLTGPFPIPQDQSSGGGTLEVRGLEPGHSLQSFRFKIVGKENQNSRFQNLRWSMYVNKGNRHFEIALGGGSNVPCGSNVYPVIYYSPDGGNTYQAWKSTTGYPVTCTDEDGDGKERAEVTIDLIGTSQNYEYTSISGSELTHFNNEVGLFDEGNAEDLHSDPAHGVQVVEEGDQMTSDWLIKHYFARLEPNFDLKVDDQQSGGGAGVDEGHPDSGGYIDYPGGDRVVTYLHITKNRITVEFE